MSFENISAENRNQMPIPRRVFHCSFCRQPGHSITRCDSDRILEFEVICASVVRNFNNTDDFKNWLLQYFTDDVMLLRAFAIRKFHITLSCSLDIVINLITDYIFRKYRGNSQTETIPPQQPPTTSYYHMRSEIENELWLHNTDMELSIIRAHLLYLGYLSSLILREPVTPSVQRNIVLTTENNPSENLTEICNCSICWDDKEKSEFVKLNCNHEFCKDCMKTTLAPASRSNLCCALCRSDVTTISIRTQEIQTELSHIIA